MAIESSGLGFGLGLGHAPAGEVDLVAAAARVEAVEGWEAAAEEALQGKHTQR
jgi:hypothetical protein